MTFAKRVHLIVGCHEDPVANVAHELIVLEIETVNEGKDVSWNSFKPNGDRGKEKPCGLTVLSKTRELIFFLPSSVGSGFFVHAQKQEDDSWFFKTGEASRFTDGHIQFQSPKKHGKVYLGTEILDQILLKG